MEDKTKEELFFESETRKHQLEVAKNLMQISKEIFQRAVEHDNSKLESPEREIFIEYTPKLKNTTYGSEEYNQYLKEMKKALSSHYAKNRHHPEFHENISEMNLVDLIEMLCDWVAATKRHDDGDIEKSIDQNQGRFKMEDQLTKILKNTVGLIEK